MSFTRRKNKDGSENEYGARLIQLDGPPERYQWLLHHSRVLKEGEKSRETENRKWRRVGPVFAGPHGRTQGARYIGYHDNRFSPTKEEGENIDELIKEYEQFYQGTPVVFR